MSESTLSLKVADIKARLARFAGWDTDADEQNDHQRDVIDDAVGSGLRRFYYPDIADQVGYEWSFLKPVITLTLEEDARTIKLPGDYTAMAGSKLTLAPSGTTAQPYEILWTNEGRIRELFAESPSLTGPPMYVALLSLQGTSVTAGQQFELYFFPAADQAYSVQMAVSVAPNMLDGSAPYAWGGSAHTETILESCLAIMEERLNDVPAGKGPHSIAFHSRLMASIVMDRRNKPPRVGYNGDRSDDRHYGAQGSWHYSAPAATYNGASLG